MVWTDRGVVLYSGRNVRPDAPAESWIHHRGEWRPIAPVPPPRRDSRLVYDSDRRQVVLFGGNDESGLLTDTWEFDGTRWTQRAR